MQSKKKATMLTLLVAVFNSVLVAVFNLIYNNLLMRTYGSDVNGLISTLTQFVSLFAIIEGGFATAAVVSVYEPYVAKDYDKLNDILYTTKRVYLRVGTFITVGVLFCGIIYLRFVDSPFSYLRTYSLLFVTVLATSVSLCFQSKYSVLLQGANCEYIQVLISLVSKTVTWILSIVLILEQVDILLIYGINILNVLLNIGFSRYYEKKNFSYVTYQGTYDKSLIKGTGDVLFQKAANTIFTSTDLVLISSGVGLAAASVYNLYQQVFRSIFNLLAAVVQAPFNSLGHLVEEGNREKIDYYFKIYFKVTLLAASVILTVTGSLVLNFVSIYTAGVTDIDYVRNELAFLFFAQYYVQIINRPFGTMLNVTGNFAKQNVQCGAAAVVNLVSSIILMRTWGVAGVIVGSFLGTSVILVMNVYQCKGLVAGLKRMVFEIVVNVLACVLLIVLSVKIGKVAESYWEWVLLAIIVFVMEGVALCGINFVLDYKTMKVFAKGILSKVRSKFGRK